MIEQIIFYFGAAILGLFALFVVLELVIRTYDFVADTFFYELVTRADYIDPEYHPYLNVWEDWSKPMFVYHPIGLRLFNTEISIPGRVSSNRLGFRCEEFAPPDPDELRIVLLGGSAAWGSGATSNETTIAGHLERMANGDASMLGSKKRAKCYNLAQLNGFQTQDVLTLAFFVRQLEPDIIVSFSGWNELIANYPMKPDLLEKYGVFYVDEMEGWEPVQVEGNRTKRFKEAFREWGSEKSRLLRRLIDRTRDRTPEFTYSVEELKSRLSLCSKLFIEHLETIKAFANSLGAAHIQFLQPNLYLKNPLTSEEARVISLYDDVRPVHGGKMIGDYIRDNNVYAEVLRLAETKKETVGPIIDLSGIFENESRKIFYTLVHMTDEGQGRIAERIYQELSRESGLAEGRA